MLFRGIILYAMLCGRLAFGDDVTIRKTQKRDLTFPAHITLSDGKYGIHSGLYTSFNVYYLYIYTACKHLISNLLTENSGKRLNVIDALHHVWMTAGIASRPYLTNPGRKITKESLGISLKPKKEYYDSGELCEGYRSPAIIGKIGGLGSRIYAAMKKK